MTFFEYLFLSDFESFNVRPNIGLVHKCVMVKDNVVSIRFIVDEPDMKSKLTSISLSISHDSPHPFQFGPPSSIILAGDFE